jgi:hypothetical protein
MNIECGEKRQIVDDEIKPLQISKRIRVNNPSTNQYFDINLNFSIKCTESSMTFAVSADDVKVGQSNVTVVRKAKSDQKRNIQVESISSTCIDAQEKIYNHVVSFQGPWKYIRPCCTELPSMYNSNTSKYVCGTISMDVTKNTSKKENQNSFYSTLDDYYPYKMICYI